MENYMEAGLIRDNVETYRSCINSSIILNHILGFKVPSTLTIQGIQDSSIGIYVGFYIALPYG